MIACYVQSRPASSQTHFHAQWWQMGRTCVQKKSRSYIYNAAIQHWPHLSTVRNARLLPHIRRMFLKESHLLMVVIGPEILSLSHFHSWSTLQTARITQTKPASRIIYASPIITANFSKVKTRLIFFWTPEQSDIFCWAYHWFNFTL